MQSNARGLTGTAARDAGPNSRLPRPTGHVLFAGGGELCMGPPHGGGRTDCRRFLRKARTMATTSRTLCLSRVRAGTSCARVAAVGVCTWLTLAGCQFFALRENLRILDRNGYLRGTVAPAANAPAAPLVVFAVPVGGGPAADWVVLPRPGPYFLVVPVGRYRVGAFQDQNHSLVHEAGEAVGWLHGGEPVEVPPGDTLSALDLTLGNDATAEPIAVGLLPVRSSGEIDELPASGIGEVMTLDDPRFSEAAARIGLWRPAEFLV